MRKALLRPALSQPIYLTKVLLGCCFAMSGCGSDRPKELGTSSAQGVEAACSDGVDNDMDGQLDCVDPDCQSPGGECVPAPPLDRTVATTLSEAAAYLYTGDNPLQKRADANAFVRRRIAILRGRVIDADGAPLSAVKISAKGHPEYGYTYSRGDGLFDMAVNGGARLVLNYELLGHLPVQRAVQPGWQRYLVVPDAGLIEASSNATAVVSNSEQIQVILGDAQDDAQGARQPLVVIEPNTVARALLADGEEQELGSLIVTATEYPISEDHSYSPGSRTAKGGLSYGLEFAVKEADAMSAEHVAFSQPVSLYIENLADMPVGKQLVVQHYDRAVGQWEPGTRGQVIGIVDVSDGVASVDIDGDGAADNDEALLQQGITESDRRQLGQRYQAGQKLWHAELVHFSGHELQAQGTPPSGAVPPVRRGLITRPLDTATYRGGMLVEHQASTHREPIVGTPYSLHYQSNRTLSYGAGRQLEVPLLGENIPNGLKKIICRVTIANRVYEKTYDSLSLDMRHSVTWDGKDAVGRLVQSPQTAEVSIGYAYRDARTGNVDAILPVKFEVTLGNWDARAFGLGGFSVDAHHVYDPGQQILYFGDGSQKSAANVSLVTQPASNDATFSLGSPDSLVVAADGRLIFSDDQQGTFNFGRILRIGLDGKPEVLFGDGAPGVASNVLMTQPAGIVATSDDRLIVADIFDNKIVKINPDGTMVTLVSGDAAESPVVQHTLNHPDGMALGPRDELYFVDADKVYRLEAGKLEVIAGGGTETIDNGNAMNAMLMVPSGLAVDKAGFIYVSERGNGAGTGGHRVRRIAPWGDIDTVAGTQEPGFSGDGDYATTAQLNDPHGLAMDQEDRLYIVDQGNARIRRISADGIIQTVIGGGTDALSPTSMAVNIKLDAPDGIAAGPDGALYIAQNNQVIRAFVGIPQLNRTDNLVPSRDGRTLFRFDERGRHLETIDAVTGLSELTFGYDSDGLLETITDADGNTTAIKRDPAARRVTITSRDGQATIADLEQNGDVARITDALLRTTTITWDPAALVETINDPKSKPKSYLYDLNGRLVSVADPAGYQETLSRTDVANGWTVAVTAPVGRTTNYTVQYVAEAWQRTRVAPDGTKHQTIDAGATLTQFAANGTKRHVTFEADPTFGGQSLNPKSDKMTLPSGKSVVTTYSTAKEMVGTSNPLDLALWTDTTATNGRQYQSQYTRSSRILTEFSPMNRARVTTVDARGHSTAVIAPGRPITNLAYDFRGRANSVQYSDKTQIRTESVTYDSNGWVDSFTNALSEKTGYSRDVVGRLTELERSDQAKTLWELNNYNQVESLTPPGRAAHRIVYDFTTKQVKSIAPPAVTPPGAGDIAFEYDPKTQQLSKVTRADSRSIGFEYDTYGRLAAQILGKATINVYYTTGHVTRINRSDGVTVDQSFDGPLWTGSKWSGSVDGDVKATYDDNLWLSSLTVNSASTVSFKYDPDGLLTSASASAGAVNFARDASTGQLSGIAVGNAASAQTYSDFGELTHLDTSVSGALLFAQNIVTRDPLGRITHLVEVVQGVSHDVTYEYDLAGRLSKETRDGVATTYGYDLNGNRTSVQVGTSAAVIASFDAQDRIATYGTVAFKHTNHGDLELRTEGTKTLAPEYDELGNLLKVTVRDGATTTTVEYIVDGLGRRVARRINGQFDKKWLYRDSSRPVAEVDSAGVFTQFVYGSNHALSGAPDALIRAGAMYRVVKDHLGSVRLVVNAQTGAVAQSMDYDAYGRVLSETGAGFQPFGFAGGLYDATTKLVRFGARDYDPETGRWTNKDPIGFGGQQGNVYVYVSGDPVNLTDPNGTVAPLIVAMGIGGVIGGAGGAIAYTLTANKFEWSSLGAATAGGAVAGALAPLLAAEFVASGAVTSVLNAGLLANSASGVVGSLTTSALDPNQDFFSAATGYNAISSGVFSAVGYVGADKAGRLFAGSQFFAEGNFGSMTGAAVGLAPTCGLDALVDYLDAWRSETSMQSSR